jgi:UDP-N-acetylmuramate dehydrogenase
MPACAASNSGFVSSLSSVGGAPLGAQQRQALKIILGDAVAFDVPLGPKTSMRVGGPAAAFAEIGDAKHLVAALAVCESERIAWTVIGLGSNLLVRDAGFGGVVIRLGGDFVKISVRDAVVRAGGGAPIVSLCREAARAGLRGAEGLVGVPGTVGGAVRMNAGTDIEIGDLIERVEVVIAGEKLQTFTKPEFAYRRSTLDRRAVVCAAELGLEPGTPGEVQAELRRRIERRNATQPLELPNFGSVFKNPPGDHAARLIEASGCKGWRVGGAEVSTKHANFIVNRGGATCAQVVELISKVRDAVREKQGVALELEVHIL